MPLTLTEAGAERSFRSRSSFKPSGQGGTSGDGGLPGTFFHQWP